MTMATLKSRDAPMQRSLRCSMSHPSHPVTISPNKMESEQNGTESTTEKNKASDDEESTNEDGFEDYLEDHDDKLTEVDKRKLLRSGAWLFFRVLDVEQRVAVCTLCQDRLSYRTTSANLGKHLRRKHFIEFVKDESEERDGDGSEDPHKRSNISAAWEYFEVKDRKRRVATCKLCSCACSYWSSVSNLMKHVRRKHGVVLMARQKEEDRSNSPTLSTPNALRERDVTRSTAWNYFKILDRNEKLAMCLICKKRLSYRTTVSNLRRHLYRKHPSLKVGDDVKRVLISSDGQLFEIEETTKEERIEIDDDEEQPTIDIDSVFIDDFEGEVIDKSKRKTKVDRREKKRKKIIIDTGHSDDTSSDEITFQKRYTHKKTDSLDQFGKYLVSIMRQLPKELSNQLQMDFVKQVMTAQLTYDSQQKIPVPSNGYAITITGNEQQNTGDHQYVVEEHVVETQQVV